MSFNAGDIPIIPLKGIKFDSFEPISPAPALPPTQEIIKLSWQRWLILFAFFLFGFTSFLTDELSPILRTMLELLELPLDKYVYISLIFGNLPLVTTIPTAWFIDRFGIRITMYITTFIMLIRNGSKALLFNPDLPGWKDLKIIYWMITFMSGIQVISIFSCMPLKISENWFSKSERSLAWVLMISSGSIGTSVAAFTYPRFIHSVQDVKPLFYLNIITAIISAVAIVACVTKSKPKYPPSERMIISASVAHVSYFKSIKKMFKHKDIIIHLVYASMFDGFMVALVGILQDILMNSGHDEIFVGNLMSITPIVSLVTTIIFSTLVHRLKNITLVCKLSTSVKLILFAINMATMLWPTPGWAVLASSIILQISASWVSPNFNNMNAHLASGVVSEATIAGFTTTLLMLSMTTCKAIFVYLIGKTQDSTKSDYSYSMLFAVTVCSILTVIYLIFFKGGKAKK